MKKLKNKSRSEYLFIKLKIIIYVAVTFLSYTASGKIINVPKDYSVIQTAVTIAKKGDTILVERGRYYENINFRGKEVTLASNYILTKDTADITNTVIDGSKPTNVDSASCIMLISNEMASGAVMGFTITNGRATLFNYSNNMGSYFEGGGIILAHSTATISHNIIINNSSAGGGGGIATIYGNPTIINNIIANNRGGYGNGITINISGGKIINNIICHNDGGEHDSGGGIMLWVKGDYPVVIENNTITGNYTKQMGGGIYDGSGNTVTIKNNIIWGNRAAKGAHHVVVEAITYSDVEWNCPGEGNIASFPKFKTATLMLDDNSPCIDAGIATKEYNDLNANGSENASYPSSGTTRNDMGAFGGSKAEIMNTLQIEDLALRAYAFDFMKIGTSKILKNEILNRGNTDVTIDSIKVSNTCFKLLKNFNGFKFSAFMKDSLPIECNPLSSGEFNDTLFIYHSFKSKLSPIKVALSVKAYDITTPVIQIEKNMSVKLTTTSVRIDGSKCYDNNNIPLNYSWKLISKPIEDKSPLLLNTTTSKPTLVYNYYGAYTIAITVDNGFYSKSDTLIVTVVNNLGIEDLSNSENMLRVFPNPATDKLNILLKNGSSGKLEISDIEGRLVFSVTPEQKEKLEIDLAALNIKEGLYVVNYILKEGKFMCKFIYTK